MQITEQFTEIWPENTKTNLALKQQQVQPEMWKMFKLITDTIVWVISKNFLFTQIYIN